MAWVILTTVTIFYTGKFLLLSYDFLKVEIPITVIETVLDRELSLNDLTPQQLDEFVRLLQQKNQDKVNWKVEGF